MKSILQVFALLLFTSVASMGQVTQLNANKSLQINFPISSTKTILMSGIDSTLWVTDALPAGTFQLSTAVKYKEGGTILNNKLIFPGKTTADGTELWITDGTVQGTSLLKDIYAGVGSSNPGDDFTLLNGFVYFTAETAAEGRELWRTDGTTAGTTLVKDIIPGTTGSNLAADYQLFSTGSYLLFDVKTTAEGSELWRSDGTANGTFLLKDINPGAASSNAGNFFQYNNIVLFSATDAIHGMELWKTDGTANGTELIKDIRAGTTSSVSYLLFSLFNGRAYFSANDGIAGDEIWSTDGTSANTLILKDIQPGAVGSFASLLNAINVGTKLIFPAFNMTNGFELWETDGTTAGTKLFKDIVPGSESSSPLLFPNFSFSTGTQTSQLFQGNKFFLMVDAPGSGYELWISDGTAAGTKMVKDINPGDKDGIESVSFAYSSTAMYFSANDGTKGNELWKTDGTEAGTTLVADINPGSGSSDPTLAFFPVNNKIILEATDGDNPTTTDLYVIDGVNVTLPVKLLNFTVMSKADDAILQWSTAQEINSKDYTIQRSFDGINFTSIASVIAEGTSSVEKSYSYIDAGVLTSGKTVIYYRLIINDKDGKTENSKIISINLKAKLGWTVKLNNNPVVNNMSVIINGVTKNLQLSIKDITGKTVYNEGIINSDGQVSISLDKLTTGIYFLTADYNNERKVIQFLKQ